MKKFTKPAFKQVDINHSDEFHGVFEAQTLERGFGLTLGNSLRRILLSNIIGSSSFAIKIRDVSHEFSTVPGVSENVVNIILNVKKINFIVDRKIIDDTAVAVASIVNKSGVIKAQDLILPYGVEVANPDQVIAHCAKTLAGKSQALNMEIFIRNSRGFLTFEDNKKYLKNHETKIISALKTGQLVAIDSNFSPIVNVNYKVEKVTSTIDSDEEKLIINITTTGIIKPFEAIAQAANILIAHLQVFEKLAPVEDTEEIFEQEVEVTTENKALNLSILDLDLSVRSYNCLKRSGIETIKDLVTKTLEEVQNIKNLGKKSLKEIIDKMEENTLTFSVKN